MVHTSRGKKSGHDITYHIVPYSTTIMNNETKGSSLATPPQQEAERKIRQYLVINDKIFSAGIKRKDSYVNCDVMFLSGDLKTYVSVDSTRLGGIMARDFYSYSIPRTIVLVPPTPLSPELLRSLVSTMAAAGSSALPSPVSGRRPNYRRDRGIRDG